MMFGFSITKMPYWILWKANLSTNKTTLSVSSWHLLCPRFQNKNTSHNCQHYNNLYIAICSSDYFHTFTINLTLQNHGIVSSRQHKKEIFIFFLQWNQCKCIIKFQQKHHNLLHIWKVTHCGYKGWCEALMTVNNTHTRSAIKEQSILIKNIMNSQHFWIIH